MPLPSLSIASYLLLSIIKSFIGQTVPLLTLFITLHTLCAFIQLKLFVYLVLLYFCKSICQLAKASSNLLHFDLSLATLLHVVPATYMISSSHLFVVCLFSSYLLSAAALIQRGPSLFHFIFPPSHYAACLIRR